MLFYYCWFNAELVLHSRADRGQLFSLAKWSCLLSVRPPPSPWKTCMWISTSFDWITVAWEQRESRLIMQCLSDRFGNIWDFCVAWTMLWWKNECALEAPAVSQDHEEEEEDCWNRLLKSVPTTKVLSFSHSFKSKGLNLIGEFVFECL